LYFNSLFNPDEEVGMGLFDRFFKKESNVPPIVSREQRKPDMTSLFEGIAMWSAGKRFTEADPKYSEMIRSLPPDQASSMRLSRVPGTISITGEHPTVFGYPGSLELNMPALTSLSGMARVLLDLGYAGVEQETGAITESIMNRKFRFRISFFAEQHYPLVRLQIGFYSGLQEPLFLEVLSDILDRNVQDFYSSLIQKGSYEISAHAGREHLASVFCTIPDPDLFPVAEGLNMMVAHLKNITPSGWNMQKAVRSFERHHPLGEGMGVRS